MLPNFLIVGAAKAGTTSIYYYLKQNPEIYLSPKKEPKFITSQFLEFPHKGPGDSTIDKGVIHDFNDYKALFEEAEQNWIGEASADNLYYYKDAISCIKHFLGEIKIIAILRNPVERAYSAYMHMVRDSREKLSFEQALLAEDERRFNNWEFIWFYKDVGFYARQIKAYSESFREVKVYLYDDLKKDPVGLIKDICDFLEVDSFVPDTKTKFNVSGVPKNKFLHTFLHKPIFLKKVIRTFVRFVIPKEKRIKIMNMLTEKNLQKIQLKPETHEYLKKIYREDILQLQDLIDRDLTHWLK